MSDYESDNNSDYEGSVDEEVKIRKPISSSSTGRSIKLKNPKESRILDDDNEEDDQSETSEDKEDLEDDTSIASNENSGDEGESDGDSESEGESDRESLDGEEESTNKNSAIKRFSYKNNITSSDDEDYENDGEEDEYGEEDDTEEYVKKLSDDLRKTTIQDFYPDLQPINTNEVEVLSHVVRDSTGTICDPFHTTVPFITKYEKAKVIGERARQINAGAKPLIDVEEGILDGYVIALKEFEAKKTPFIIKRPLPNGGCEYWRLSDLEYL